MTLFCHGCHRPKEYDPEIWRNYSAKPGCGVLYVCGDCAEKSDAIKRVEAERQKQEQHP